MFLEKDLEEIIFKSDKEELHDRGLWAYGKMLRQVRIGNYGIADLITIYRPSEDGPRVKIPGNIKLYELKKDKIGIGAFLQAVGYMKGIQEYLKKHRPHILEEYNFSICLIGKKLDTEGNFCYLTDLFTANEYEASRCDIEFYTYQYDIDGIRFKMESDYALTNSGF